jgi:hypothetical protein
MQKHYENINNNKRKRGIKMKVYNISFVELVTSQVKIKAETLEKAKEIVNSGNFYGDEVIDRDNFEITESYEESEE